MAYVGLDRDIVNHWIYQDAEYFKVWFQMLHCARFSTEPHTELIEGQLTEIKYGEFIFGRIKWSERLKISERRLRTLVDKLIADNMIHLVKRAPKFSIYCVTNFAKYRQVNDQQETEAGQRIPATGDQHNDQQTTSKRPANDQQTTTKEERKNVNNDNKEPIKICSDIVSMKENEYQKLVELMTESVVTLYIERFEEWIVRQPAKEQKSRSPYLSIRNWYKRDTEKIGNGSSIVGRTGTAAYRNGGNQHEINGRDPKGYDSSIDYGF